MASSEDSQSGSHERPDPGPRSASPEDRPIEPSVRHHAPKEARVLGGSEEAVDSDSVWDREPLTTMRAERRLFRVALPLILLLGLVLGFILLRFGLQVALIGMLIIQTGGFFAIYVLAQRRRMDPLRRHPNGGSGRNR